MLTQQIITAVINQTRTKETTIKTNLKENTKRVKIIHQKVILQKEGEKQKERNDFD